MLQIGPLVSNEQMQHVLEICAMSQSNCLSYIMYEENMIIQQDKWIHIQKTLNICFSQD